MAGAGWVKVMTAVRGPGPGFGATVYVKSTIEGLPVWGIYWSGIWTHAGMAGGPLSLNQQPFTVVDTLKVRAAEVPVAGIVGLVVGDMEAVHDVEFSRTVKYACVGVGDT